MPRTNLECEKPQQFILGRKACRVYPSTGRTLIYIFSCHGTSLFGSSPVTLSNWWIPFHYWWLLLNLSFKVTVFYNLLCMDFWYVVSCLRDLQSRNSRSWRILRQAWMRLIYWYHILVCLLMDLDFHVHNFVMWPFSGFIQIRKMDLEARSLQPNLKAMLLAKLREYKSGLNNLKREVKRISSPNHDQSAREELLEAGGADAYKVLMHSTLHEFF